jgi:hypothetical protein
MPALNVWPLVHAWVWVQQEDRVRVTEEADVSPPSPRAHASLTAHPLAAAELVLFGGECYDGRRCVFYNDLYRYHTERRTWRRVTSPNAPGPRSSHQAVATPTGHVYVFGGPPWPWPCPVGNVSLLVRRWSRRAWCPTKASLHRSDRTSSFTTRTFGLRLRAPERLGDVRAQRR